MKNKELYNKLVGWLLLMLIITMALIAMSCEKQEPFKERIGLQYDSVPFVVHLENVEYIILIEGWPTGLWGYMDEILLTPAYDPNDPQSQQSIYYRRFVVYARIDSDFEYVGWNTVADSNFIDREHLNPYFIDF